MNQPSNHTQTSQTQATGTTGNSFPSQQSGQSNPFTADLKGEFTSNFGTNTNAVSQIFKDGGFASNNHTKWIALGVVVLVILVGGWLLLQPDEPELDFGEVEPAKTAEEQPTAAEPVEEAQPAVEEVAPVEEQIPVEEQMAAEQQIPVQEQALQQAPVATGAIQLISPANGDARAYDETSGPAVFSWDGAGGTIVFSRHPSMTPAYMRVPVSGNSYSFYNPYPGTWYWRVESAAGVSETRSFVVQPPVRRNIALNEPQAGGQLAGNGGVISWAGDQMVAFYRVELSADGNFAAPAYRFATSRESLQTQGVAPGQYQMRIGAFSEVAGRWEYSEPVSVNVQ